MNYKNLILFFCIICPSISLEAKPDANSIKLTWYQVNNEFTYEVNGCIPNSQIAYYSEVTGGKLLKLSSADQRGYGIIHEKLDFHPAFALNQKEPGANGIKGNSTVSFTVIKEFNLKDIHIEKDPSGIVLQWNAAVSAPEMYHFEILKSINGKAFTEIGIVKSLSAEMIPYSFNDNTGNDDVVYKLRITNGATTYTSDPLILESDNGIIVFPTITNSVINIRIRNFTSESMYRIINNNGQSVSTGILQQSQTIVPISDLIPGTYIMQVTYKNKFTNTKFVKN